jgi:UDP-N-acetylmuramate--alanine ligase
MPDKPASIKLDALQGSVHLIGIGGIGMSALARLLLARGIGVSGSDKEGNLITDELQALGAKIFVGHDAANIEGAGVIVVSTAITDANPELKAAKAKGLPIVHRSQLLSLLADGKKVVAISGTHGKTTTTGMVAQIFLDCGTEPDVVVGGIFDRIGSNAYAGRQAKYFIAEADESDRTHAEMPSYVSIVTNIEPDHLENYPGGITDIQDHMVRFVNNSKFAAVLCADDPGCKAIGQRIKAKTIWYGNKDNASGAKFTYESSASGFRVFENDRALGEIRLNIPGDHNKLNALGAVVVGLECGLPFAGIAEALSNFKGVDRRFQLIGTKSGITVIDDYGHHPTEVRATLAAARQYQKDHPAIKRVVALFQPHQPGRLRDLWDEFCNAFDQADLVLIGDIYVARGGQIEGINSKRFAAEIKPSAAIHVPGPVQDLPAKVAPMLQSGDLVLTIGAGDITKAGAEIIKLL